MGEAVHVWGQRVCGNSLYLPLSFTVSLKTALKNKTFNKKNNKEFAYRCPGMKSQDH